MLFYPAWNILFQSAFVAFICPVGKQSLSSFQLWTKVYSTRSKGMCLYREIHQRIFAFIYGINTWFPLRYLRSFYVFPLISTLGQIDNFYYFICGSVKPRERYLRSHKKWKGKQKIKLELLGCTLVFSFPFFFRSRGAYMNTEEDLIFFKLR